MLIEFIVARLKRSGQACKPLCASIVLLSLVAGLFASAGLAEPQSKARAQAEYRVQPRPADSLPKELQSSLQTLQTAKQSGDAAAVASASRAVIGIGLRESGRIDLLQGSVGEAIESYRRSIDFVDSAETRIELAEAYLKAHRLDDCLSLLTDVLVANPDNAHAWYVHGKLWMTKKKYDEAVKSFTHVLNTQSDEGASYLLGAAFLQLKDYEQAKSAFGKLKENQKSAQLHRALADAYGAANYMDDYASELRQAGSDARTKARGSPDINTVLASAASLRSSFESAKPSKQEGPRIQRRRVELRTILANALNDLGTAEARQEKYGLALAHFHEAARWDPNVAGLLRNTGVAAGRTQDYPECIRALRQVVGENPKDNVARAMLGTALFASHSYAEAVEVFTPLGDVALQVHELGYSWAASLVRINKYPAASELLNKLEQQQLSADTLMLVAQLWSQMGNYEHTVEVCHRALGLDPRLARAHYIAGQSLLRLNRSAEAAQELRDELQLDPENTDVQFHLAFSLLQQSQTGPAVELLKTVVARKPDHAEANYELGKELLEEGKANEALSYLEAAVRLKPQFEPAHYQLQSAYRAVGRKEDADREASVYRALKAKSRNITLPPPREPGSATESPH